MDQTPTSFSWMTLAHMILSTLGTLLSIYLAHRRRVADRERRRFYFQMRQKHGLHSNESERKAAARGDFL